MMASAEPSPEMSTTEKSSLLVVTWSLTLPSLIDGAPDIAPIEPGPLGAWCGTPIWNVGRFCDPDEAGDAWTGECDPSPWYTARRFSELVAVGGCELYAGESWLGMEGSLDTEARCRRGGWGRGIEGGEEGLGKGRSGRETVRMDPSDTVRGASPSPGGSCCSEGLVDARPLGSVGPALPAG